HHPHLHSFPTRRSSDLHLLILVLSGNLLGALHGFLRLHGHFFKSQHSNLNLPAIARRGWRDGQPLPGCPLGTFSLTLLLRQRKRSEEHTSELQSPCNLV